MLSLRRFQRQKPSGPGAPLVFGLVIPQGKHSPLYFTLPLFQRIFHVFHFIATISLYCAVHSVHSKKKLLLPLQSLLICWQLVLLSFLCKLLSIVQYLKCEFYTTLKQIGWRCNFSLYICLTLIGCSACHLPWLLPPGLYPALRGDRGDQGQNLNNGFYTKPCHCLENLF